MSEFPAVRPRRLRSSPAWRRLVRETRVSPAQLILPLFVREGATEALPIGSMPGVVQHSRDSLKQAVTEAAELGLGFDAMNSNTFSDAPGQPLSYKFGSLSHTDPAVRARRAQDEGVDHQIEVDPA